MSYILYSIILYIALYPYLKQINIYIKNFVLSKLIGSPNFTGYYSLKEPSQASKDYFIDNCVSGNNPNVYLISDFMNANKELDYCKNYIYKDGLYNMDYLVSKKGLYYVLGNKSYLPLTYSRELFLEYLYNCKKSGMVTTDRIYIMKKDIQRQQGLYISNNVCDMIKELDTSYVIVQEYLKDPYIINDIVSKVSEKQEYIVKRKINIRVYVLVVIKWGVKNVYVYNDGFLYYTSGEFKYDMLNTESNSISDNMITSGYIDRDIYERNPLTIKDLQIHEPKFNNLFKSICKSVKEIMNVYFYKGYFEKSNNISYQIFGMDVEPDSKMESFKILEFNKCPDLNAKDNGRDCILKNNLVKSMYDIVLGKNNSEFIQV